MVELQRYRSLVADNARWDGFQFRQGDIVISTPPKAGTTWTQMLCALLIFDTEEFDRPLSEISPWLDMQIEKRDAVIALLEAQRHRRFIKTHTPLDGIPFDPRVTYLCVGRDPRDISQSSAHHIGNLDTDAFMAARAAAVGLDDLEELGPPPAPPSEDPVERFWQWADEPIHLASTMSLAAVLHHLQTFWDRRREPGIALFHYGDLLADLPGQFRRLAGVLGIEVTDARIAQLAAAARFDRMKERAADLAPGVERNIWRSKREFFHRGSSGQWRELLDAADLRRYEKRVTELATPDLAAWAHAGWLGASAT